MATHVWIDADNSTGQASPVNSGIYPQEPLDKLATAVSLGLIANGTTIYISGKDRSGEVSLNYTGLVFHFNWPAEYGMPDGWLCGDEPITGGWTNISGNVWENTVAIATGLNIASVVSNWWSRIDSAGRHYGHLAGAASNAAVAATANTYFYTTGTGKIRINHPAGDPNGYEIAWCRGGVNALEIDGNGHSITGYRSALWCDATRGPLGYHLYMTGNNNTVSVEEMHDAGYHSWGFVAGNCTNNVISGGLVSGIQEGGIQGVFHCSSGNMGGGNVCRGMRFEIHTPLGVDGQPLSVSITFGISAAYSHGSATTANGVLWDGCTVNNGFDQTVGHFAAGDATAPSSNEDHTTYNVRVTNCTISGTRKASLGSYLAFVNCRFDYTDTIAGNHSFTYTGATTSGFFGCEFRYAPGSDGTGAVFLLFNFGGGTPTLVLIANTFINSSTDAQAQYIAFTTSGHGNIIARGNLGWVDTAGGTRGAFGGTFTSITGQVNAYFGYDATTGDTAPTTVTINPLVNAATSGELTGVFRRTRQKVVTPAGNLRGINGAYAGNYGNWQYADGGVRQRIGGGRRGLGPR